MPTKKNTDELDPGDDAGPSSSVKPNSPTPEEQMADKYQNWYRAWNQGPNENRHEEDTSRKEQDTDRHPPESMYLYEGRLQPKSAIPTPSDPRPEPTFVLPPWRGDYLYGSEQPDTNIGKLKDRLDQEAKLVKKFKGRG